MVKIYTKVFIGLFTCSLFSCNVFKNNVPHKTGMNEALLQEIEMTKDPATGKVPRYKLIEAKQFKDKLQKSRSVIAGVNWRALGPNNAGGRSRCVWADLSDPTGKKIWVGSVGGGIWRTNDITLASPKWIPINDMLDNIAVTEITQDPSNNLIMYLGTGEGYGNFDRIDGIGVFKSIDGGITWNVLPATSGFGPIMKMVVSSTGTLIVATNGSGLQRSTNGGVSFTPVLNSALGITGASSNLAYDVDLASNGDVYASLTGSVHKSTNDGATFGAALPLGISVSRVEIACAKSNANALYLACVFGGQLNSILYSNNAGVSFTPTATPTDADLSVIPDITRGQAWYDMTIAVDPNNDQVVSIGGIDLFKTINGGANWSQLSHWYGGFGFQDVHADQHEIEYIGGNSNKVLFANDGGVYYSDNFTNAAPIIQNKEESFNTLQFYSAAMHPTSGTNHFLGGTQDNGSHKLNSDVIAPSVEVTGGDGGFAHIDQDQPQYQITAFTRNRFAISTDGGNSFSDVTHGNSGQFINPSDYDDVNNKLYSARAGGQYLRWEDPQTSNTFTTITIAAFGGVQVSAVKVSPNVNNRVYFGLTDGKIIMVDNANSATPTATNISTGLPTGIYLSNIDVEVGTESHLVITYSNYGVNSVWESINAGLNWTSVEGNLPNMPIRWILLNPNNGDQAVVATELGVWSTDNLAGAATIWGASNTGLANTRVDMLQTRTSDKLVLAATHGRGMYISDIFTAPEARFTVSYPISYVGKAIAFTNTSYKGTSYLWNFGDGSTSTLENPIKTYTTPGLYNVSLTINAGASSVTKANYVQILPYLPTPYTVTQGGNFETNTLHFGAYSSFGTKWELGNSSILGKDGTHSGTNAWVTSIANPYTNNTVAYLYTPNYNFNTAGNYYMRYYTKFLTENEYDGYLAQYSLDSGTTWTNLGSTVLANWYNFSNNPQVSIVFPYTQAFYSGNQASTYTKKVFDLSSLQGQQAVAFRFLFKSDAFVTNPGAAIDDFEILGPLLAPLAVTIKNIEVSKLNNQDLIVNWNTEQEKDINTYTLQRSLDGIIFMDVNEQSAKNEAINSYNFIDLNAVNLFANETVFYKLKIKNSDNTITYSETKSIDLNANASIILSPIPCDKVLNINSSQKIKSVVITDVLGKELYKTNSVNNAITLPNTLLSGNTYLVKIVTKNSTTIRKIIKK